MEDTAMKISIVIPSYEMRGKGVAYLKHNIDQILGQAYTDYEVVVADHSVGDDIKALIESYGDIRLVYRKNTENRGSSSANMNFGVMHATGEIIKPMFQDDFLYKPHALQVINDRFMEGIKWMVMASNVTENRTIYYYEFIPKWNDDIVYGNNTISGPTCVAYLKANEVRFDERLIWLMDVKFYYDMYRKYGLPYIEQEILVTNFKHPDQYTNLIPNKRKQEEVDLMKQEHPK
jgi:glycosyltransferase involved in cell wall biosynthesis